MQRTGLILGAAALGLLVLALSQGMMGGGMMGGGMMGGGMMAVYPAGAQPIPEEVAKSRLEAYAKRLFVGARLKDFMPFSQNYYVQVVDEKGQGLAELIVDRYTGVVSPEPGPNMMWNTYGTRLLRAPQYEYKAARSLAETFLKGYLPGAKAMEGQAFPGYYTFDFGRQKVEGMLSVNAYTGKIWVHTWHGFFLGEE